MNKMTPRSLVRFTYESIRGQAEAQLFTQKLAG